MSRRALVTMVVATLALVAAVVLAVDWSESAVHDPARALLLGPRESFVAAQGPNPPVFGVVELVLFLCAGLSFVISGTLAWRARPDVQAGALIAVAGLLWLSGGIRRSSDPALFTAGALLTNLYLPVLIHMVLGFPSGRLRYRWERWFVGGAWLLATVGVACEWLFFDPRLAESTYPSTSVNLLLIRDIPALAEAIQIGAGAIALVMGATLLGVIGYRWRTGSPAFRAGFTPLALACLLSAALTIWILVAAAEFPDSQEGWVHSLRDLRYPTTALLPIAVVWGLVRYRLAKAAISDAMVEIGNAPVEESFVGALRRALHDPTLVLWTYEPERGVYVDEDGGTQTLPSGSGPRAATVLERDGVPLGALVYDETLRSQPELLDAVRGAAGLALEHARLQQELRAQLVEVRRSRERIVTAGDTQRRRLERDLHDGAQQRLVAAELLLRRAQRAPDGERLRALLSDGATELATALIELRELARGVYPPVLADRGIAAALNSLAERAPLPVEIHDGLRTRPPAGIELAAYFIAAEAVANSCKYAGAGLVAIELHCDGDALSLEIADDGIGGAVITPGGGLSGLSDRIAALGGTLTVDSPVGGGTRLTAVLPFTPDAAAS
ncbi:sensor histidine kinase [Nocardia cyriacigeorgica]|uniref:histidine kinase n=1 Tax=Nocardia cyriacigeorgica TaxID=135487 RepID=A0ABX0CTA3_9NOCA|nr:ATP-binding protein [Nocardia cyriacigeorgica]NEW58447.1 sensor histidine kinase [Nocardia cyriacigeorgica]